jgi:hypothetical protein
MLATLLNRNIASVEDRLVILTPHGAGVSSMETVLHDAPWHAHLTAELQRLRGRVYLADGALKAHQLSVDGRHQMPEDAHSWHVLIRNHDRVTGCIWYREQSHPATWERLRLRESALARDPEWGSKLRAAVEADVRQARGEGIGYAEVGGWAVDRHSQLTDCLLLVLSTYGLSQILGGAFVLATATVRHASTAILRRLGGLAFSGDGYTLPRYYDPRYECEMDILRFDTMRPNSKFVSMVESLKEKLAGVPVIAAGPIWRASCDTPGAAKLPAPDARSTAAYYLPH